MNEHGDHHHMPCPFCSGWQSVGIFYPGDEFVPFDVQMEQLEHMLTEHADRLPAEETDALRAASQEVRCQMVHDGNRAIYGSELMPFASLQARAN